ncbi:hypothetical protein N7478_004395 [Penicillium angulare]|uniref:uncharacterized protein n=1 Tax=Penicillium angulare TaxID=116970 RepID=UPI0025417B1B|nr:uncharacterized protein N7478_004395 [Penicillium angulare]KAJ5279023.1 hypothetical protein N7478_004395 [Penicillium angulare]
MMANAQNTASAGHDSESRHAAIFGVGIGFIVFDSIVIALRIYVRAFMLRAVGTDDILMIIGAILNFGLSIATMIGAKYGIGKPASAIKDSDTVPMLQLNWRKKAAILGIFGLGILSVAAACVRYNFVTKLTSATSNYYLVLADSLNWCAIEGYVAIFCGCAPSLSILFKTYLPSLFGPKSAKYESTSKSPGTSNLQRINPRKGHRRRGLGDTTLGSQDAIVTAGNTDPDHDGIMMKTDIRMDVAKKTSTEDMTYQREYYEFSRRP